MLLSVQSLLQSPEPKDPQDAIVARQFMNDNILFNVGHLYIFLSKIILENSKILGTALCECTRRERQRNVEKCHQITRNGRHPGFDYNNGF